MTKAIFIISSLLFIAVMGLGFICTFYARQKEIEDVLNRPFELAKAALGKLEKE